MAATKRKLKIAIFDLTDCEGCELTFIALREKLATLADNADFANWRLASDNHNLGPFDATFIEGSPITETDIEAVKQARAASRFIITLGSCAALGGVQSLLGKNARKKGLPLVYGEKYETTSKQPRPVSYYIDVDYNLPGCPVNARELEGLLGALLVNKRPNEIRYPVCLECKAGENDCLLLEGEPCLGPITKGGCNAACPSKGLRCWGCFGALRGGNLKSLNKYLGAKYGKARAEQLLETFMIHQNEFKEIYPKDR